MTTEQLTVAVIGDPHFFVETLDEGCDLSHIKLKATGEFVDAAPQNPWLALKGLVKKDNLCADVLVCVGDMTVYADKIGLVQAWRELQQLGQQMRCSYIASATGNHDVQSRSTAGTIADNAVRGLSTIVGSFEQLKLLAPPYPVVQVSGNQIIEEPGLRTQYFGDSVVLVENCAFRLVVLNTCCEHTTEPHQHERGSFPASTQAALERALATTTQPKINILVCHHPPGIHGDHDLGNHDFIEKGDALLRCLEKHGSWVIIHGHKHHGRISYAQGSNASPVVFSASSLGYYLDVSKSGMRNQFYRLKLDKKPNGALRGRVEAWDWHVGCGWTRASSQNGGIYDGCGFGFRRAVEDVAEEITQAVSSYPCKWSTVIEKIPDLAYLTPTDMVVLANRLNSLYNIAFDPEGEDNWAVLVRAMT